MKSNVKKSIHEAAQMHGISDIEFLQRTQEVIDQTWANPDCAELRSTLFPNGKPTVAEFIDKVAELVEQRRKPLLWRQ